MSFKSNPGYKLQENINTKNITSKLYDIKKIVKKILKQKCMQMTSNKNLQLEKVS